LAEFLLHTVFRLLLGESGYLFSHQNVSVVCITF